VYYRFLDKEGNEMHVDNLDVASVDPYAFVFEAPNGTLLTPASTREVVVKNSNDWGLSEETRWYFEIYETSDAKDPLFEESQQAGTYALKSCSIPAGYEIKKLGSL
jgi:hypothetical protein